MTKRDDQASHPIEWDAVVLGLGGVGSFALRALSLQRIRNPNMSILGIERFQRGHDHGSSHGQSRIYRRAYFEHPSYVPWIQFSIEQFQQLQKETNTPIIHECGTLLMEPEGGEMIHNSLIAAKEHQIPTEFLDNALLRKRFPQFHHLDDTVGVFEPTGGLLRPENATCAALAQAERNGATIWENTVVKSIQEIKDEDGKVLHVEMVVKHQDGGEQTVLAKTMLVAAGAWTSELIPSYAIHLRVIRQLQAWIDVSALGDQSELYNSSSMPGFVISTPKWSKPLYGLPADDQSDNALYKGSIKLGIHGREHDIDPNHNPTTISPSEVEEMRGAVKAGLSLEVSDQPFSDIRPCMYTMTDDEHFIIGVPKGYQSVCTVAGLSGHGFKMVPALGQMLADFATGKGLESWQAEFCSPARFGL